MYLQPNFEPHQVRHFWTNFHLFCIFGKVFESTLRVYQWDVGIAIFGCAIWEMVLKIVRKMVKSLFEARFWIWTSSPFVNRFWFTVHIWKGIWKYFKSIPMRCWYYNIWLRNLGNSVEKCAKMVKSLFGARFWIWTSSPFLNRFWFSLHIWKGIWKYFKSIPMRGWYCNIWLRNWGKSVEKCAKNG